MALAIMAAYIALVASIRWSDSIPPRISLAKPFTLVGPETPLSIHIEDEGTGLQEVSVRLVQNLEQYILAEERFSSHGVLSLETGTQHTYDLNIVPFNEAIPKRRGPATLIITARDYSWRGFLEGNWVRFNQDLTVKFTPPKLELLSVPLPMTQGGAGVVFFRTSDESSLEMLELTLMKMANGGIYDQLGGGFHRYSTDPFWLVPHFEKMLYDNALFADLYSDVYKYIGFKTTYYWKNQINHNIINDYLNEYNFHNELEMVQHIENNYNDENMYNGILSILTTQQMSSSS